MPEEADGTDERDGLGEGVEHLQLAAREVIKAGRSLLDAAEGLIEDPQALQGIVGTLSALAQTAIRSLRLDEDGAGTDDPDDDGKVQKITLS